jgi:hypothetical protein
VIAPIVITDAKGKSRTVTAETFMRGRKECGCGQIIRAGVKHTCPRRGENGKAWANLKMVKRGRPLV